MLKHFGKIAIVLFAAFAMVMIVACDSPVSDSEPTGALKPSPGLPSSGGGGTNADYEIPAFGQDGTLPPPAFWNSREINGNGEIINWPDPFVKNDGTRLIHQGFDKNLASWLERREEIKKLVEYYYAGTYPAQPTKVEVSGTAVTSPATTGGSLTITVTGNGGRTTSQTFTGLTIPAVGPNGLPPSPENKIPLVLLVGASATNLTPNGYASMSMSAASDVLTGIAQDIWQYDNATDDSRPNSLEREAWKCARIMDAFEIIARDHGGVIDPDKFLVSGMSRWGKDSLYIGAFAESMSGKRIAVTNPVSSGTGGAAPDHFIAQAGGKNTYFYKIVDTVTSNLVQIITEDEGGINQNRTNPGFQTNPHARNEQANWFGRRLQEFTNMYKEWTCNWQSATNPGTSYSSWHGISGTLPLDSHYLLAMCAPYGLITHDGWDSTWTNAEGMYVAYLATQEVYDYIGKAENNGIRIYKIGHSQPAREYYDLVDFANLYFNRTFGTDYKRLEGQGTYPVNSIEVFMDQDPKFGLDDRHPNGKGRVATWFDPICVDPKGRHEYLKLNWAAPGKPAGSSVADIVKKYFDDNDITPYNPNPVRNVAP